MSITPVVLLSVICLSFLKRYLYISVTRYTVPSNFLLPKPPKDPKVDFPIESKRNLKLSGNHVTDHDIGDDANRFEDENLKMEKEQAIQQEMLKYQEEETAKFKAEKLQKYKDDKDESKAAEGNLYSHNNHQEKQIRTKHLKEFKRLSLSTRDGLLSRGSIMSRSGSIYSRGSLVSRGNSISSNTNNNNDDWWSEQFGDNPNQAKMPCFYSTLTQLILSNNQLTGSLPPSLSRLRCLTELRLDGNQFSGPVMPVLLLLQFLVVPVFFLFDDKWFAFIFHLLSPFLSFFFQHIFLVPYFLHPIHFLFYPSIYCRSLPLRLLK